MAFRTRFDWVPAVNYGTPVPVEHGLSLGQESPLTSILLVTPEVARQNDGEARGIGQPEDTRSVTVKRIRGNVIPAVFVNGEQSGTFQANIHMHERIHVGVYDFTNGAIALPIDSLLNASDANERFLWERHQTFDVSWALGGSSSISPLLDTSRVHPYYCEVDVKAQRRVEQGFALLYSVSWELQATAGTDMEDWQLFFKHSLRTYVRA